MKELWLQGIEVERRRVVTSRSAVLGAIIAPRGRSYEEGGTFS